MSNTTFNEELLKEARDMLVMASLLDKSGQCIEVVNKIDAHLASQLHPVSKSEGLGEELVYWRQRCLAAEHYIDKSPCDPDIAEGQMTAYAAWKNYLNNMPDFSAPVSKDALSEAVEDAGQRGEVSKELIMQIVNPDKNKMFWTPAMVKEAMGMWAMTVLKAQSSTPVQEGCYTRQDVINAWNSAYGGDSFLSGEEYEASLIK